MTRRHAPSEPRASQNPIAPSTTMRPHPSLPIVCLHPVELPPDEKRRIAAIARRLLADEPQLCVTWPFGAAVASGLGPGPALFLEDHSWIALINNTSEAGFAYRSLVLAGEGDQFALAAPRVPAFERYCRELLKLGRVEVVAPAPGGPPAPLARRCADDPAFVDRLASRAAAAGSYNLVPYMATGGVWVLAGRIAEKAGVPVRVAAAPPRLTWRVNDKLWFAQRVTEVLGRQAQPPGFAVFSLSALVARALALGRNQQQIAIKLPSSASSWGNIVLDMAELRRLSANGLHQHLKEVLRAIGWDGDFPLLVTAWEAPVVSSPSVQLWIPGPWEGGPIVEGIFDQTIVGPGRAFIGARPTGLDRAWQDRLALEAYRLGTLWQLLGYYGRCSFDAILVDARDSDCRLHWVECNGRWGGTSIPMTLANRLGTNWGDGFLVVDEHRDIPGLEAGFAGFLATNGDELFVPEQRPRGLVVLAPGRLDQGKGFEFLLLGHDPAEGQKKANRIIARLSARPAGT